MGIENCQLLDFCNLSFWNKKCRKKLSDTPLTKKHQEGSIRLSGSLCCGLQSRKKKFLIFFHFPNWINSSSNTKITITNQLSIFLLWFHPWLWNPVICRQFSRYYLYNKRLSICAKTDMTGKFRIFIIVPLYSSPPPTSVMKEQFYSSKQNS